MVDKVDECPLNCVVKYCLCIIGSAKCVYYTGCLSIEVNGRTVGIFGSVCYTVDVCYEVCLLSRVPL